MNPESWIDFQRLMGTYALAGLMWHFEEAETGTDDKAMGGSKGADLSGNTSTADNGDAPGTGLPRTPDQAWIRRAVEEAEREMAISFDVSH